MIPASFAVAPNGRAAVPGGRVHAEVRLRWWHPGVWRLLWAAIGDLLPVRLKLLVVARVVAFELVRPAETWLMARGAATKGTVRRAEERAQREAERDE